MAAARVARPAYSRSMAEPEQLAALVALLRTRAGDQSWSDVAAEVAYEGDAVSVWNRLRREDDALFDDPGGDAALDSATSEVEGWLTDGLHVVTILDDSYPRRLLDIRESPPLLFYSGALRSDDRGVSVVGSRRASDRGLSVAGNVSRLLVGKGLVVISGLAAGIDTAAHRAALSAGGRTVAFLGTGIRRVYPPSNAALQQEIARKGLVLSQFWPDAPPTRSSFPMRNAGMSGYGLATVVVEAGETSGARIQARLAVQHGRPVILTDDVVGSTKWGASLVDRPGVFVASGLNELGAVVDRIIESQNDLVDALQSVDDWVA